MLLSKTGTTLLLASTLQLSSPLNAGNKKKANARSDNFAYFSEQVADLRILRYQLPDFDKLSLQQKTLLYYLSQAALAGRDIFWDQNYRFNLTIRRTLEGIVKHYSGERNSEEFGKFMVYCKRVWFANGIHHHYGHDKILPAFSKDYLGELIAASPEAHFPVLAGEKPLQLLERLAPIIFDPTVAPKKVVLDSSVDMVVHSAVNFYRNITQAEASEYYRAKSSPDEKFPPSYGLNSRLVKQSDGSLSEQVYKVGGLYGPALEKIVFWLSKAASVAETPLQGQAIDLLIEYYRSGDLKKFDAYNIAWVQDTTPAVDFINGFIEVYDDPLGYKGSFESVVSIKDFDATAKYSVLSHEAAWFEAHSPIAEKHKRPKVTGVSYKVINVASESGGSSPATPIGINLPNSNWLRIKHGSKSVSLGNIEHAYDQAAKSSGVLQEFYLATAEHPQQRLLKEHGTLAGKLATGLHEVIGHASGQLEPGVANPAETLKNYASALEEARADLVALYYIADEHMKEIGLIPSPEVVQAEYISYITNGMITQLARIDLGKQIEEAHMRNRQMIAKWAYEHGKAEKVIERVSHKVNAQDKTYFVVNDYGKLRTLFGELLREVQRIKSQGDYNAGKELIETYGVSVDKELHQEVKRRWESLHLAPFSGFINPKLEAITSKKGKITGVKLSYPKDFTAQMLEYGAQHSFLPNEN